MSLSRAAAEMRDLGNLTSCRHIGIDPLMTLDPERRAPVSVSRENLTQSSGPVARACWLLYEATRSLRLAFPEVAVAGKRVRCQPILTPKDRHAGVPRPKAIQPRREQDSDAQGVTIRDGRLLDRAHRRSRCLGSTPRPLERERSQRSRRPGLSASQDRPDASQSRSLRSGQRCCG